MEQKPLAINALISRFTPKSKRVMLGEDIVFLASSVSRLPWTFNSYNPIRVVDRTRSRLLNGIQRQQIIAAQWGYAICMYISNWGSPEISDNYLDLSFCTCILIQILLEKCEATLPIIKFNVQLCARVFSYWECYTLDKHYRTFIACSISESKPGTSLSSHIIQAMFDWV